MQTMVYLFLIYLLFLAIFLIFNAAVFYHFFRFAYKGDASRLVLIVYSLICLTVIVGTFVILSF